MRRLIALPLLLSLSALAWGEEKDPVAVTLVKLGDLRYQPELSAPAQVVPLNRSRLAAEINARIEEIPVRVGQRVKAGDPLVVLDCRDHRSRLEQQQAELARIEAQTVQAERRLQRARNLVSQRNIAEEETEARNTDLDSLRAQARAQQAAIEQQQRNVERCTLKAPFDGQVEARLAAEAELATPGTPLVELLQLDDVELEAQVRPETLQADDPAEILFTYQGRDYPVTLARRFASVNPRTGTVDIRLRFTGESPPPGAAGRLLRRSRQYHLPADYLQLRQGQLGLFLLDGDKARFHPLKGAIEGRPAPVDLAPETPLIDQGRHGLKDGEPVSVRDR